LRSYQPSTPPPLLNSLSVTIIIRHPLGQLVSVKGGIGPRRRTSPFLRALYEPRAAFPDVLITGTSSASSLCSSPGLFFVTGPGLRRITSAFALCFFYRGEYQKGIFFFRFCLLLSSKDLTRIGLPLVCVALVQLPPFTTQRCPRDRGIPPFSVRRLRRPFSRYSLPHSYPQVLDRLFSTRVQSLRYDSVPVNCRNCRGPKPPFPRSFFPGANRELNSPVLALFL